MAIKNTNLSPLLKEGTGIALTSAGQVITITSTGAGALPAGSDTQVQFNDAGVLGADAGLTYNKTLNILGLEAIDFAVTPTAGTAERRLLWDNDEGSLNLTLKGGATNIALGAEVAIMSYNAEATTLNKGEVVYLYGAQGQRPSVKRAVNTSDATSATTFGMVAESIASGAAGFVMQMGIVRNIDTNAYNEGDILYLGSTAGSVTTTKPSAPAHMVFVGVVLKKNVSSGRIFVKPQNGYELDEIHNVAISSVANNDLLVYESSSTLWKNKSISTILGYTPEQPLTFSSPLSRSTNTISIPVATSLANGYLSSSDFAIFSGKQNALSGTGIVKSTSGTISYLTDNSTNWDTAYTNRITSLTTTGSSGASTLVSNTLNIPNYTLAGLGGFANPMSTLGDTMYGGSSGVATRLLGSTSASKVFLSQTGTGTASAAPAWSAVSKSDVGLGSVENTALSTWAGSTNITTLGTIGTGTWSASTIAVDKGGTGATTLTGVVIGSGTSAFTAVAGTASQLLRRNAGNTAYEFFTPTYLTSAITSLGGLTASTQTFANDTNVTITSATSTHTLGWSGQLSVARGGTGLSAFGTSLQLLRVNSGATALEYFTPTYLTAAITSLNSQTGATQTFANDTNVTITSATNTHTIGWSGQLSVARGGTNSTATPTNGGISYGTGTAYSFTSAGTSGQALVSAGASAPSWTTLTLENLPDAWVKKSVDCATTTALTLNTAQTTIDGVTISASSRVLVKNQATASQNGIYTNVTTTSWTRSADADTASKIAGAMVNVDAGTTNGGLAFDNDVKTTDTLGTTAINWNRVIDTGYTIPTTQGGTGLTTIGTANQLIRVNAGATALEYFTPSYLTSAITSLGGLTASTQTFANDTNVTITSATSTHTLGWTGQLSVGRGGTGASTLTGVLIGNGTSAVTAIAGTASQLLRRNAGNTAYEFFTFSGMTNPMTTLGDIIYEDATPAPARLAGNITTTKQYLSQTGTGTISAVPAWSAIAGADVTGAALTKTDDTNVTLTLGGTPATSLLRATSLTLGWTGQLAVSRGGTGLSALGTANQLIRVNAGATALEYFTPTYLTSAITSLGGLTASTQTFANDTNVTITSATSTHTLGWSGQLAISRGGTGVSSVTTTPTASAFAGWDANANLSADNFLGGYTTTATSGITTTLVVGSTYYQYFTGTSTQTIVLPVVTTLVNGFAFRIVNLSTGNITINTSGGNAVQVMGSNTQLFVYVINTAGGTGTASWDWNYSIVKNANLPATIAGATTTNALAKFNSTGGLIADSNIIDNGTLIQLNVTSYHTGGVYNSSFYGSQSGIDISPVTWLGTSGTTNANFALNYSSVLKTLGVNNDYVSVPILTRSITEASSGTHNLFSQVAIQALSLTNGVATTTNSATLYVEGATTGTATITNNYAVWVDDGVTRLDGTAIINGADATTNSVKSAGYFQGSLTTGTPAVGIGTSFGLNTQTAAGTYKLGSVLSSISTNVTSTTEAFDLAFANMTGGATATERMRLKSTGQLQLNAYTTGTTFTGTPVGTLMTTSAGNVIIQESSLQFTSLNISATQVNSAFTTPVTLVSSPGAGKIIVPHTLVFFLNSAGTAFATNTNYGWMLGATLISATKSFAGTTDFYNIDTPTLTNGGTAVANAPLQWKVQTGNSTLGTGATISIGVVYSILSVS